VALLSFGEGWHNNHHAYPTSARHGLAWYEIDISWWEIRFLQRIGLATFVRRASLSFKLQPPVAASTKCSAPRRHSTRVFSSPALPCLRR
jgi:hypothetical protein